MNKTTIEWCRTYRPDGSYEHSFTTNPVRFLPDMPESYVKVPTVTMCQKVSPGCANCYAESITRRFWPKFAGKFPGYTAQGVASGQFVLSVSELQRILHHRKPCRLFWGDMTDLFQESIPDEFLDHCFAVCALTPHITHIFLTKRAARMPKYWSGDRHIPGGQGAAWYIMQAIDALIPVRTPQSIAAKKRVLAGPLPNYWLGVSVENHEQADKRIRLLLQTPAAVRFISAEPLLAAVDLTRAVVDAVTDDPDPEPTRWFRTALEPGDVWHSEYREVSDGPEYPALDWVIVGGESGRGARPMHPDWARSLRDQCQAAGVPFFMKQMGSSYGPHKGHDLPDDLNIRQFPEVHNATR